MKEHHFKIAVWNFSAYIMLGGEWSLDEVAEFIGAGRYRGYGFFRPMQEEA